MPIAANRRSIMILYSDGTDPLDHCVRVVLAEKDINVEINYIEGERPAELNDLNPYPSILTLVDRDLVLYEARIIMEYLDERFPHPPLLPVDPVGRANKRQLQFRIIKDLYSVLGDLEEGDKSVAANARKAVRDHLTSVAPVFAQYPYFMSDDFTLVDCCMAPLLWRLPHYNIKLPNSAKPLLQYAARLFKRKVFKKSLSESEREYTCAI